MIPLDPGQLKPQEPMSLVTRDLIIGYSKELHAPFDLTVKSGEILAILGPSGCGKSTLLGTIAGMIAPLSGDIFLGRENITHVPIHQRRVGLVFQDPLLFPHLSIIDNIAYGLRAQKMSKNQARARSKELLAWVGLEAVENQQPWQLSGGQAGRVALARALAPDPKALLLDEPYSALDTDLRIRLSSEVAALIRDRGIPCIHVTHDPREAEAVATEILHFSHLPYLRSER